jgi:hypothetical protein
MRGVGLLSYRDVPVERLSRRISGAEPALGCVRWEPGHGVCGASHVTMALQDDDLVLHLEEDTVGLRVAPRVCGEQAALRTVLGLATTVSQLVHHSLQLGPGRAGVPHIIM